jgi:hypothetical protein
MAQLTVKPTDGGTLVTRASSADVGAPRYTAKVNWRRDLTDEMTREGWDYFNPLPNEPDYQSFPFPGISAPINLVHHVRRPNGDSAMVVGTSTTLYRFNTLLQGYTSDDYANGVNDGVGGASQPYFAIPTRWQIIGSGFNPNGRRWEAVDVNGSTIFSNGVDLPVEYRVEYWGSKPLYELREQGVLCVGAIGEESSIFMAGDTTEVQQEDIETVLGLVSSGSITVSQEGFRRSGNISATSTGTAVTSTGEFFSSQDVGRVIIWSNGKRQSITGFTSPTEITVSPGDAVPLGRSFWITNTGPSAGSSAFRITASASFFTPQMDGMVLSWPDGSTRRIVEIVSGTVAVVDSDWPLNSGKVKYDNPKAYLGLDALKSAVLVDRPATGLQYDQRQYRVAWSELENPTRFAVRVPCVFDARSGVIEITRTNRSITIGDSVIVEGAGQSGGSLKTTVTGTGPGIITIKDKTLSSGTGYVIRESSVGSTAGYEDLQDDGSAILKIAKLQGRVILYKDTNIFVGRYTGVSDRPFEFERIVASHGRSIYFRHTLVSLNNTVHFYAGRNRFYQFDLTTRTPSPVESADYISDLFYDYANIADSEQIYAADNHLTQEVWITCPASPAKTLAYDHVYKTFSTIDFAFTAAAPVKDPSAPLVRETSNWFVMGTSNGVVLQYGLSDKPNQTWGNQKSIWYRRGSRPYSSAKSSYQSVLSSGLIHFGDAYNEKRINAYNLQFSSHQVDGPIADVYFFTALNQDSNEALLGTSRISNDGSKGLIPLHTIANYIRDEVRVRIQKPIRIHQRTWDFGQIASKSHHRK